MPRGPSNASGAPKDLELLLHPDANLLSSFIERTLTEPERAKVLNHLAECSDCRELVMLVFSDSKVEAAMASAAADRAKSEAWLARARWFGWFRRPALRWGVLAAALVVMVAGTIVYRRSQQRAQIAQMQPPAVEQLQALRDVSGDESASNTPTSSERNQQEILKKALEGAQSQAASTATYGAPRSRSTEPRVARQEAVSPAQMERQGHEASQNAAAPLLQPPTAPAKQPAPPPASGTPGSFSRLPVARGLSSANQPVPPPGVRSESNGLAVTGSAAKAPVPSPEANQAATEEITVGKPLKAAVPGPLPPAMNQTLEVQAATTPKAAKQKRERPVPSLAGSPFAIHMAAPVALAARMTAHWSVTSNVTPAGSRSGASYGRVERSLDGGKTWQVLHVDDSVSFRAVSATGADVWAGGSGGALYHSSDGGMSWTRVQIMSGQAAVTDTITEINFADSRRGMVKTDTDEEWVTVDGGQHWMRSNR